MDNKTYLDLPVHVRDEMSSYWYSHKKDYPEFKEYRDFVDAIKTMITNCGHISSVVYPTPKPVPMPDENCPAPKTNDETVSGNSRYGGKIETIDYLEYVSNEWAKNGLTQSQIGCLWQVLKYLSSRLGKKDNIMVELGKARNYLTRAMTGKWEVK